MCAKGRAQMLQPMHYATLGGGCFWCLEAVFQQIRGVLHVESGYSAGFTEDPTYQQVCAGVTGHAEVVNITYDPSEVTYRELLEVFFSIHDPTTLNRQGADVGTQYRSIILFHNEDQKEVAAEVIRHIDALGIYDRPIVTEVKPLEVFYRAEDYHQNFYLNNPGQGYCRAVIAPKVAHFRRTHLEKLAR
ncbi:peptide methionine sulfoxide reductase MsrA [Deinococcus cellulosilyticus NBRC 106333 = KACC 11606]|uniref:Peptide methionine sulfoxide reductase MsrA n=2 Tax=Deinococcus cellulosilyticus TaxID=401558 RepID=A0A511N3J8_DEIC1|nr:peptide methionine sulfoxide reductase MsrA [Deinococcus cellulosilyticus NBRC 106333 = KACC 11606]